MRRFTALFLALLLLCSLFVTAQAASPYYIEVDLTAQIVTVYRNDNRTPSGIVRQMACSSGVNKRTPTGTFSISTRASTDRKEWYWLSEYQCYVQYATRITGHILFHSLPTVGKDKNTLDATAVAKFGSPASHGCIRLRTEDAAWIARNIPDGTICRMFYGKKNNDVLSALMESCYSAEDGLTYEEFLGYSDDPNVISRNSDAETVRALQAELQSLGYYGGALDGVFSPALRVAIRAAQSAVDLRTSGLGEATLIDAIDNDEIPLSTRATLGSGMSGRAVERLQNALSVIGFYTGDNDGIYSDALAEAVRNYGLVYGLPTAADTSLQNAVISAADVFVYPYSDTFSVNIITDRHGQMRAKSATYLYSRQSTSGKKIVRVPKKAYVEVLSRNGSWSYCRYGNAYGWMKNSKGTYSTYVTYRAEYVSPDNVALQERLASLGYYTGSVNGVYDDLTLDAVAAWQADNGYTVDGVIADDSRTAINTEGATTSTRRRLDIGSEGESVKVLQQSLLTLGYYNGEIDGIYSDALAEAVLNYGRVQRINTVADTTLQDSAINNADTFTFPYGATYTLNLRSVRHAYMRATRNTYLYSKQSTGGSRILRVPKGATVAVTARNSSWSYCIYKGRGGWMRNKYGSYSTTTEYFADYSCPETEALQQRLVSLGYFTGSVNGIYNAETIEAVAAWQNDNGQEATGEVTDDERLSIGSESATTSTRRQLTVGSEGESVKVLQRSLQALGYYDGEIDGIYSEALGSAVRLSSLVRSSGDRTDADANPQ
ncbi:MAG: peptidoglycan-binding protein, partial [Clostridia bacterium]|nr:peptidoglycan-binding protein [Clostridia bacterium]